MNRDQLGCLYTIVEIIPRVLRTMIILSLREPAFPNYHQCNLRNCQIQRNKAPQLRSQDILLMNMYMYYTYSKRCVTKRSYDVIWPKKVKINN